MKHILTLLICAISLQLSAQNLSEKELIGIWKVTKATVTVGENSPEQQQIRNQIKQGLTAAEFEFLQDQSFLFRLPASRPDAIAEMESISGSSWKWNAKDNRMMIGSSLDGYNLMHLNVVRNQDQISFLLPGIELQMKKL